MRMLYNGPSNYRPTYVGMLQNRPSSCTNLGMPYSGPSTIGLPKGRAAQWPCNYRPTYVGMIYSGLDSLRPPCLGILDSGAC